MDRRLLSRLFCVKKCLSELIFVGLRRPLCRIYCSHETPPSHTRYFVSLWHWIMVFSSVYLQECESVLQLPDLLLAVLGVAAAARPLCSLRDLSAASELEERPAGPRPPGPAAWDQGGPLPGHRASALDKQYKHTNITTLRTNSFRRWEHAGHPCTMFVCVIYGTVCHKMWHTDTIHRHTTRTH